MEVRAPWACGLELSMDLSSEDPVPDRMRAERWRRRFLGALPSVAAHLAILAVILLLPKPLPVTTVEDAPITVSLVPGEKPSPAPKAEEEAPQPKPTPPQRHTLVRREAKRAPPEAPPAGKDPKPPQQGVELSASDLAGATSADSGGGGGQCDLARQLQGALRKDPLVQAAVAGSGGKAIMVWNGDWVRGSGEDGKGLAAVREAISWEIAFAPEACKTRPVHGLILLSLNTAPGGPRLAIGAGEWRWSDLVRTAARP
jgi:hypothetical protein